MFTPPESRTRRRLDLLSLKSGDSVVERLPDTSSEFPGGVLLSAPIYLGDMSFGALSGVSNIAIARAAESMNVAAGTGEGGLLPEVEDSRNITVQWASGRFGVTAEKLRKGMGVVIKIGQGAKPGIGAIIGYELWHWEALPSATTLAPFIYDALVSGGLAWLAEFSFAFATYILSALLAGFSLTSFTIVNAFRTGLLILGIGADPATLTLLLGITSMIIVA